MQIKNEKRLKYGEYKAMTPEEQKAHRRELRERFMAKNRERVRRIKKQRDSERYKNDEEFRNRTLLKIKQYYQTHRAEILERRKLIKKEKARQKINKLKSIEKKWMAWRNAPQEKPKARIWEEGSVQEQRQRELKLCPNPNPS